MLSSSQRAKRPKLFGVAIKTCRNCHSKHGSRNGFFRSQGSIRMIGLSKFCHKYRLTTLLPETLEKFSNFFRMDEAQTQEEAQMIATKDLQDLFSSRLRDCYKLKSLEQKNNFLPDSLFWLDNENDKELPPRISIQFKRPAVKFTNIYDHVDQIKSHGFEILSLNPALSHMLLILTNGWEFYVGHVYRKHHGFLEFLIVEKALSLYDRISGVLQERSLVRLNYFISSVLDAKSIGIDYQLEDKKNGTTSSFTLGKLIGKGASSFVYEVLGKDFDGKPSVVKFCNDEEQFEREIEVFEKINFEALKIHGYTDWEPFIVLERARPILSSMHFIKEFKGLSAENFKQLLLQLKGLHDLGYVHRDIRPANIFLRMDGTAVIGDFGTVTRADTPDDYAGSWETASQRVLEYLKSNNWQHGFSFSYVDDYESFLKLFFIYHYQMEESLADLQTAAEFYDYWKALMGACLMERDLSTSKEWYTFLSRVIESGDVAGGNQVQRLRVSNLADQTTTEQLRKEFVHFPGVLDVSEIVDCNGKRYGLVNVKNAPIARAIIAEMNGTLIDGRKIYVGYE